MILIQISEVKKIMTHLLLKDSFDWYEMEQAEILTFAKFTIDGKRNRNWYDSGEQPGSPLLCWREVKERVFAVVKGERTPDKMKISLRVPDEIARRLLLQGGALAQYEKEQIIPGFHLQLRYEKQKLVFVTGVSYPQFTQNKEADALWDRYLCGSLKQMDAGYDIL